MLYGVSRLLEAALKAQGVPFPVVFGPERGNPVTAAHGRIVIEHGGPGADNIRPPLATHRNPTVHFNRIQGAFLRIFARSNLANAQWHDHTELAEAVLGHVLAELDVIVRGGRNNLSFAAGGFVQLDDSAGSNTWPGAIYELPFGIDRAIERRTWAGGKAGEVTIGTDVTIVNHTKVSAALGPAGTPPVDAETAAGG